MGLQVAFGASSTNDFCGMRAPAVMLCQTSPSYLDRRCLSATICFVLLTLVSLAISRKIVRKL
ncbi:hypothetical protein SISSUDRAFT_717574 [Sistotremastrum suecicum HHB10207 ss-3]|uniref:Uncharacterized protein n=1 Tax=Sistotremastrum suecicum HHB10207 ss-3 TaxID=1314776 RepID=A0A165WUA5_9AGAM|nr:hypothetical protein SISSUDRAFT_717574 [Sistotremastrum suecicum HHB10207 ss-3]